MPPWSFGRLGLGVSVGAGSEGVGWAGCASSPVGVWRAWDAGAEGTEPCSWGDAETEAGMEAFG